MISIVVVAAVVYYCLSSLTFIHRKVVKVKTRISVMADRGESVAAWKWKYLAEGRANIVFSCEEHNFVLRVRKRNSKVQDVFSPNNVTYFNEEIIKKLLHESERYFVSWKVVSLSKCLKGKLEQLILHTTERPDCRLNTAHGGIENYAMVIPNVCFLQNGKDRTANVYAVEIKPKWGFLPKDSIDIKPQHHIKCSTCRFCMQQYLKLKKGQISQLSSYCPLDLFAHCSCRVKRGLRSLFQAPQNNLRLFHNGKLTVSGLTSNDEQVSHFDNFFKEYSPASKEGILFDANALVDILTAILIHDSQKEKTSTSKHGKCASNHSPNCAAHGETILTTEKCIPLGSTGILQLLVKLQEFDGTEIERVWPIFQRLEEKAGCNEIEKDLEDFSSKIWRDFVCNYLRNEVSMTEPLEMQDMISEIQKFLVAATFRDCSLMISFQETSQTTENEDENIVNISTALAYKYDIKLIDLDAKSFRKLKHYYDLDHEIVQNYLVQKDGKICCS